MNYKRVNWVEKIKGSFYNKVAMALCQNNFLTNLFPYFLIPSFPSIRHSERSEESLNKISKPHGCIPVNTGKILKQVQDDSATHVDTLDFALSSTRHSERSGATHVGTFDNNRRAAFTLAEVLITLGIIGVVAALTIPNLINEYQKIVTATQLKKTFSTLSNAFTMAQKDHGDMSSWSFKPKNPVDGDNTPLNDAYRSFTHTYLFPYLRVASDCETGTIKKCDYTMYSTDGSKIDLRGMYRFILNNSTLVILAFDSYQGDFTMGNMLIYVDINGPQKPNTVSKDIFTMQLYSGNNTLKMYGFDHSYEYLMNGDGTIIWACTAKGRGLSTSAYCGAVIQKNGWKIPDDYPWF